MRLGTGHPHAAGMTSSISKRSNPTVAGRRLHRTGAVVGAAAAALLVWVAAVPAAGLDLAVHQNGQTQPVGPGAVVVSALFCGLVGWALLAVLERFGRRPHRVWTVVAVAVLVVSLAAPLASGVGTASRLVLAGMHLAVAAVLVPVLRRAR
jgi:hypothetical protein